MDLLRMKWILSDLGEFKSNGEVIWNYSKGGYTNKKGYYYTEGNILYFLDIGDGFKMNNWVRKMKYEIDEKKLQRFRFKSIESTMWEPVLVRKQLAGEKQTD